MRIIIRHGRGWIWDFSQIANNRASSRCSKLRRTVNFLKHFENSFFLRNREPFNLFFPFFLCHICTSSSHGQLLCKFGGRVGGCSPQCWSQLCCARVIESRARDGGFGSYVNGTIGRKRQSASDHFRENRFTQRDPQVLPYPYLITRTLEHFRLLRLP